MRIKCSEQIHIETSQDIGSVRGEGEEEKFIAPKFLRVPPNQTVQEGKVVRFDCRVTGRPYPEVSN